MSVVNPETGRSIKIDGPTFNTLIKTKKYTRNELLGIIEPTTNIILEEETIKSMKNTLMIEDVKLELIHHLDFNSLVNLYYVNKSFKKVIDLNLPILTNQYHIKGNTFTELLIDYIKHVDFYTLYELYNNIHIKPILNRPDIIAYFKLKYDINDVINVSGTSYDTNIVTFLDVMLRYLWVKLEVLNQPEYGIIMGHRSVSYPWWKEEAMINYINLIDLLYKNKGLLVTNYKTNKPTSEKGLYDERDTLSRWGYKRYFTDIQQKVKGLKGKDLIRVYEPWLETLKEAVLKDMVMDLKNKKVIL